MNNKSEIENYLATQSPWNEHHPGCWYQAGIELPHGIVTKSYADNADCREIWKLLNLKEQDIKGKDVLDIGCNTGYYAMRCKEMGANRVVGFDASDWIDSACKFSEWKGLGVKWQKVDFYQFDWTQQFDLVFALQVIYHLREEKKDIGLKKPLKMIADSCRETLSIYTNIRSESYDAEEFLKNYNGSYIPTIRELRDDLGELGFQITSICARNDEVIESVVENKDARLDKVAIKARRV